MSNSRKVREYVSPDKLKHVISHRNPISESNSYVTRKKIRVPRGLLSDGDNALVPLKDIKGVLRSLQIIYPSGFKKFLKGTKVKGSFFEFAYEPDDERKVYYIAEGYATAYSVYMGCFDGIVLAAMALYNIEVVAKEVRKKFPHATIVIVADNDTKPDSKKNPGLDLAKTLCDEKLADFYIQPILEGDQSIRCDFNDIHVYESVIELTHQVNDWRTT